MPFIFNRAANYLFSSWELEYILMSMDNKKLPRKLIPTKEIHSVIFVIDSSYKYEEAEVEGIKEIITIAENMGKHPIMVYVNTYNNGWVENAIAGNGSVFHFSIEVCISLDDIAI